MTELTERERWIAHRAYDAGAESVRKNRDGTHARFREFGRWLSAARRRLLREAPPCPHTELAGQWSREPVCGRLHLWRKDRNTPRDVWILVRVNAEGIVDENSGQVPDWHWEIIGGEWCPIPEPQEAGE